MDKKLDLTQPELEKLAHYIKKEFGIALNKEQLIRTKKRIENLLESHNFVNFTQFYHQIRFAKNEDLIQELINAVTVNETYFWREHEQFEILANEVLPQIAKKQHHIRILVAPSSSGEELYSIMFAILKEAKVIETRQIEIVGIDIDSNVIAKARKALYSKRSIEKLPKEFLNRYFTQVGQMYQLDEELAQSVKFLQGNIFDTHFTKSLGNFDIIFSRNMLIYFEKEQKREVLERFYEMLNDDGVLFLGHADANEINNTQFHSYKSGFRVYKKV